jgi:hypothetical protein
MKPMFISPVAAALFSLVSLAVVQAPLSIESRAESDWSTDSQRPRAMAGSSQPDARLRFAGKHWTVASSGRPGDATELGYYMAPKAASERPDKAYGGGDGKPDRGRPGGNGADSGNGGGGGRSAGGADAGNADAGNSGGGNSGGRNSGDRNSGDRNARDGNSGDGDAGGGTSGDRNGGDGASGGRSGGTKGGRE